MNHQVLSHLGYTIRIDHMSVYNLYLKWKRKARGKTVHEKFIFVHWNSNGETMFSPKLRCKNWKKYIYTSASQKELCIIQN